MLRSPLNPVADTEIGRTAAAAADLFESVTRRYRKPDWNLPTTIVNGAEVARDAEDGVVFAVVQHDPLRARRRRAEGGARRAHRSDRAARRADVGPLRDAAARHGERVPAASTKSTSPIGPTRAWCR